MKKSEGLKETASERHSGMGISGRLLTWITIAILDKRVFVEYKPRKWYFQTTNSASSYMHLTVIRMFDDCLLEIIYSKTHIER